MGGLVRRCGEPMRVSEEGLPNREREVEVCLECLEDPVGDEEMKPVYSKMKPSVLK